MCYKRRAPGLPADSSGETACRAAFSSVFSTAAAAFRRAPKDELAYAVGARLGTRLQQEMPDLELSELLLGLRQAYRGEALEIPRTHRTTSAATRERHDGNTADHTRRGPLPGQRKARFGVRELTGGVLVSELRRGQGNGIGAATQVHVRYRGLLADGQVFDQSESAEWFALDSVIEGWRTALRAMPVGARWRVVIPSAQAYGHEGAGDLIPPDAPLVFEIDLLGVR